MPQTNLEILELLDLLRRMTAEIGVHRTPTGIRHGLTNQQMAILGAIQDNPGSTVGGVAAQTCLVLPSVSRTLRMLEKRGLVQRHRDPEDQRVVYLRITDLGTTTIEQVHAEAETITGELLAPLSKEERLDMLTGLRILMQTWSALHKKTR